jgi:hypothetical protein
MILNGRDNSLPFRPVLVLVDLYSGIPAGVEKPASDGFFSQSNDKNRNQAPHPRAGWPNGKGSRAKHACQE